MIQLHVAPQMSSAYLTPLNSSLFHSTSPSPKQHLIHPVKSGAWGLWQASDPPFCAAGGVTGVHDALTISLSTHHIPSFKTSILTQS